MKSIIALLSVLLLATVANATDFTTSPSGYTAEDSIATWIYLGVTAGSTALTSVTYVASASPNAVDFTYPGGLSYSNIGNIAATATGYGNVQILADADNYTLSFNVSYKKLGVNKWAVATAPLYVYLPNGPGGTGKRVININLDAVTERAFPIVKSEVSARQVSGDIAVPAALSYSVATATWVQVELDVGSSALYDVSYTATVSGLGSSGVSIGYPVPGTNQVGNLNAGSSAFPSFEVNGNSGTYQVTFEVKYSKGGNQYTYTSGTHSLTITSSSSSSGGLLTGLLTGIHLKKAVAADGVVAVNNEPTAMVGFIVGVTVGCVAAVVGVAVIAAMVYFKRSHSNAQF